MTVHHNKLVRDKILTIIEQAGETPISRILDDKEYLIELVRKLGEEYDEFKADMSMEELADVQEVVLALAATLGSKEELETVRQQKYAKRGGFNDRIYLERVE